MPDIRFLITAQDEATAKIRQLTAELQGLSSRTDEIIKKQGEWAGGRFIEKQTAALVSGIKQQVASLKEYEVELDRVKAKEAEAANVTKALAEARTRAAVRQQENLRYLGPTDGERQKRLGEAVGAFREHPQLQLGLAEPITEIGATTEALGLMDREMKSASASANVLRRSMLATAEAEGRAREEAYQHQQVLSRAGRIESEAAVAGAVTGYEVNAAANAEALADAKVRQAAANKLANEELARQTQFQMQALATEHEMNAAANLEAQQMAGRIASQRAYQESVDSVTRAMEGAANATRYEQEAVRNHINNLNAATQQQSSFFARLFGRQQMSAAEESIQSIQRAGVEFNRLNAAAGNAAAGLGHFHSQVRSGHSTITDYAYAIRKFVTEFDEMMRGQRGQMIATFGSAIKDLGIGALPVLAPIAAAFAAIKLERMVTDFGKLAEETMNAAAAAGMTVQNYSLLQRTLQVVGGDANTLARTFAMLSQGIERALQDPGSRAGGAWEQLLGATARTDMLSMLQDNSGALEKLRNVWNQMGPTLQRTELFRQALGRGFQELVPILNMTNAEFAKLQDEVRATGSVMDKETALALRHVAESSRLLGEAFSGLGLEVSKIVADTSILDWLRRIVEQITEAIEAIRQLGSAFSGLKPPAWMTAGPFSGGPFGLGLPSPIEALKDLARMFTPLKTPEELQTGLETARGRALGAGPMGAAPPPLGTSVLDLPTYVGANKVREEMDKRVRLLHEQNEVEVARLGRDIAAAEARDDRPAIQRLEQERIDMLKRQIAAEQKLRAPYAEAVERHAISDEELAMAKEMRNVTQAQRLEYDLEARAIAKNAELRRKAYEEDIALLRARLQAAHGNLAEIAAIYEQMLARTRQMPGGDERQYQEIARSYVEAMRQAQNEAFTQVTEFNSAAERLDKVRIEQAKAALQTEVYAHRMSKDEMYQKEVEFTSQLLAEEEKRIETELQTNGLTAAQKERLYDHLAELYERDAQNQIQAQEKITQAIEKENEKRVKAFKDMFDTLGSGMEKAVEGVLTGERDSRMLENLRKSLVGSITKGAFETGSQFLGAKLGGMLGVDTKGMTDTSLGAVLSRAVGNLLGLTKQTPEEAMKGVQEKLAKAADAQQQAAKLFDDAGDKLKQAGEALLEAAKTLKQSGTVSPGTAVPGAGGGGIVPQPGDPTSAAWQEANLTFVSAQGQTIRMNKQVADQAQAILNDLTARGVPITSLSGYRPGATVAGTGEVSQHAYGMAMDVNAIKNAVGTRGTMPPDVAQIAAAHGARWGGTFRQPDPMHFDWKGGRPVDVNIVSSNISGAKSNTIPVEPTSPAQQATFAAGGPVGTDTILGWLTPGERVLNLAETQAYHRMFPGGILGYQYGGVAASQPGLTSLTTESRGFAPTHLVQTYPGLGKGWLLMGLLAGGALGAAGLAALLSKSDKDQEALAKKLLEAPESGPEATRTTTMLDPSKLPKMHGGGFASDEMLAILQAGERVIPRYQTGGVAAGDPTSITYRPSAVASSSGTQAVQTLTSSIDNVSSGMNVLSKDVSQMSSAMAVFGRSTVASTSAMNKIPDVASTLGGAFNGLKSLLGMFTGGGAGGGGGGLLGGLGSVFGAVGSIAKVFTLGLFEGGGIMPSAARGMIVPRFQGGGILSMVHANEMVLPAHISEFIQTAADRGGNPGDGSAPDIHFHLHTIDQRSGAQFLMSHRDTIAGLYRSSYRNFSPNVPA